MLKDLLGDKPSSQQRGDNRATGRGTVAYFVSPHGFGHAARAAAVMAALRRRRPGIALHVFTTVPRWFFDDSVDGPMTYHPVRADVGFVQRDPFVEDLPATIAALGEFWGGLDSTAAELAATLRRLEVELVVCDVSPLGLAAADRAGLPGVLVENFTWDWIYRGYVNEEPRLAEFVYRNEEILASVHRRIQAEPVCGPAEEAVRVAPVSREPRTSRSAVRRSVGLADDDSRPLVLLTMGGLGWREKGGETVPADAFFVTLGGADSIRREPSRLVLPDRSPIFPPDLVAAADLVVAKLGYSTVAECYRAGARLAFLERPRFPESDVLAAFCRERLGGASLNATGVNDGDGDDDGDGGQWLGDLPALLSRPAPEPGKATGAEEIARLLIESLDRSSVR